jgi:FkbM family methyltransferase
MFPGANWQAANGKDAAISIGGFSIAGDPGAHGAYLRRLAARRETRFGTRLFADSIRRGAAVVHGGAHLGYHTLIAARRVGPSGRVMAFEPNPVSYRALRANVRRNGFSDRVIALPFGIGATPFIPERWSAAPEGRILSLDSTVGGRTIDLIRLTVGGWEVDALRGMRRTLELSPTARLFVECDPPALARAGSGVEELLAELRDLGMRSRVIDEVHEELAPPGEWLEGATGPVQLLCEPATVTRRIVRRVHSARRDPVATPA